MYYIFEARHITADSQIADVLSLDVQQQQQTDLNLPDGISLVFLLFHSPSVFFFFRPFLLSWLIGSSSKVTSIFVIIIPALYFL